MCIGEIVRITAPEAPYDDEKMEVFQLIVSSFEGLSDLCTRSYQKKISILETMIQVRSCVLMLDLECNQIIIEMFQHFLRAIRTGHSTFIYELLDIVMTYVRRR